ncbi:MAG: bifunctional (p)ppGpp synthetase/guanosine-3',5'-bis(diphosphate) 3'-pyrophosphohydrolase [Candidatus Tectomicrobia bacterium]|uniref:Bifunctional (P)ppGpp synthetase/guanosine-3',5'-bis(Diphosphate) 3'-pyrophosphohydrolase n=1 Tax=Tectimicrobiota bacterium TaxID=2528274 RepID=A0A937VWL7_UNCTE|nr:bifunctional (p)ppGpp synthetase/guanosine-3',5'-bis(diphosphate) 3'-pyrophosphohydrolase [Candidatus Tectomicrobia bacterium]
MLSVAEQAETHPTIDDVIHAVEQYHPKADFGLIQRAYAFGAEAHKEQKRRSGIPYIVHPLAVAHILTQLKMDAMTIASALLHDTIEDTGVTAQEVAERFGSDVAALVEGVTKLDKLEFASREERQAESFRKMVIAMAQDIRVILVKLADRLHNLRTLEHMPEAKQRATAQETLDIYAPLADRLGIAWMHSELEDLSFRYVNPHAYYDVQARLASTQEVRTRYLARMQEIIARELDQIHIPSAISGRPKHLFSIYQKMQHQQLAFEEIHDILAVRVITDTVRNCYAALGMLHSLWKPIPGRFKDYIALPKPNMYQSLHTTVLGPDGERVELQIRTEEMHRVAEEGIAAHWRYKEQVLSGKPDERFAWLRRLLEWQQDVQDSIEFMETVKIDMFQEEVYVFTPRGEVRTFPRGSTPVDFAYTVHTDIGHQCVGAKVNGRMVPLRYQLRNGDTVEILTSPTHVPSRDWLRWVVTSRARTKIKTWLKAEHKARSLALGREVCEREAQKYVPNPHAYLKPQALLAVAPHFGYQTADDLMIAVGYGRLSALQVVHKLLPLEVIEERKQKSKPVTPVLRKPRHDGIKVQGLDDILVNFARCCHPLPGDSIVGYITRGRGVTVHTTECLSVDKLEYDPERRVPVEWDKQQQTTHPARITVVTYDQQGVLAGVSSAIAACDGNISRASVTTSQDKKAYLEFTVDIRDIAHLNQIIHRVENLRGVLSVERVKNSTRWGKWHP